MSDFDTIGRRMSDYADKRRPLQKRVKDWHGDKYFLLGKNGGKPYYLQAASWDCDWYWGFGYVESFAADDSDIESHEHFNSLMPGKAWNLYEAFKLKFDETPLSDREIWQLCELMQSYYTARKYSDMLHIGGAYYTENPVKDTIMNVDEYERINKQVIPAITKAVYDLLAI